MIISAHPSSFCSFYAFHKPCSYSFGSLLRIPAPLCCFFANLRTLLVLFKVISAHASNIHSALCMLFADLSSCSLWSLLCMPASFSSFLVFYRACSYFLGSLLRIPAPFHSFFTFHRPCSYSLGSLLRIPAPFCSFHSIYRPCSYSLGSLVRIPAPFCFFFLLSTDPVLIF